METKSYIATHPRPELFARRMTTLIPAAGPQRSLAAITGVSAVALGIFLSSSVLYFTRIVHIPAMQVGVGFSVAGAASVVAAIVVGRLADRVGMRAVMWFVFLAAASATLGQLAVTGFDTYLMIIPIAIALQSAGQVLINIAISRIADGRGNEHRAYLRSVLNIGYAIGAGFAGIAAQLDSPTFYRLLIVLDSVAVLATAVMTRKLPRFLPVKAARRRRRSVLRDRPYLALTALDGVLSLQSRVQAIAVPLWIIHATTAPRWTIAAEDLVNMVLVVIYQIEFSRRVTHPRAGGAALQRSGWAYLLACVTLAWAGGRSSWMAVIVVAGGVAILTVGELWQTAGGFEVSNSLAAQDAIGEYLGVFGSGIRLAEAVGPVFVTFLCIGMGRVGWYAIGLLLLIAGALSPMTVRWAESTRSRGESFVAGSEMRLQ